MRAFVLTLFGTLLVSLLSGCSFVAHGGNVWCCETSCSSCESKECETCEEGSCSTCVECKCDESGECCGDEECCSSTCTKGDEASFIFVEPKPQSNARFMKEMLDKSNANVHDAVRFAYVLYQLRLEDKEASRTKLSYAEYRDVLIEAKIIEKSWEKKEWNELLTYQEAAYLFARAIDLEGGIFFSLLPWSERYAYREVVDAGLFPADTNPWQYVSGPALHGFYRDSYYHLKQELEH